MAGGTEKSEKPVPLDLHRASVSELMACGRFSKEVVEAIIRTRGPEGVLTMDKLVAATGIEEESWVSLVRDGVIDLECADFQAAENGDSRSAGHSDRGPLEEPRLSNLVRAIENLSFKVNNVHERLGRCEDFMQGQDARLRKCENFMQQQMTQMEETMSKRPCSDVMDRAPRMGDHGLRSEHPWRDMYGFGGASKGYPPFEGQGTHSPRMDDRTSFRAQSRYDFELDQFATHEAEHFRTFPEFSRQRQESQDVQLLLGPTAPRQYPSHAERRQESAQRQAYKYSSTGQHKPHTEDWTWSKAPTASKTKPQDRRDSRDDKGATSAQRQKELIVQQKSHRASEDVSSRQHHGRCDESPEHQSSRRLVIWDALRQLWRYCNVLTPTWAFSWTLCVVEDINPF